MEHFLLASWYYWVCISKLRLQIIRACSDYGEKRGGLSSRWSQGYHWVLWQIICVWSELHSTVWVPELITVPSLSLVQAVAIWWIHTVFLNAQCQLVQGGILPWPSLPDAPITTHSRLLAYVSRCTGSASSQFCLLSLLCDFFFPNTSTVDTVPSYFQCCCEFTYLLEHIKVIGTGKNACPNCILLLSGQTDRWMNRWTDTISLLTNLSKFVSRYKEYYIFLFFSLVSSSLYLPTSSSLFLSFETRSCYAAQDDHKLAIFLPQPPECQSYRCAHSHPACIF